MSIALSVLQNNERNCRQSTRSTVVGKAKVMSYEDIVEAQAKRDAKEAAVVKGENVVRSAKALHEW
jgi:hypothetical protein